MFSRFRSLRLALAALLLAKSSGWAGEPVLSAEEIIERLAGQPPPRLTRSLDTTQRGARPIAEERIDRLRTIDEAGETGLDAGTLAESSRYLSEMRLNTVDIPVEFEFGSAAIGKDGFRQLNTLGAALTSDRLARSFFIVTGHTDASGDESFNRRLSKRRADAVRDYLVATFRVDRSRLIALGFGESTPRQGTGGPVAANRRVEVQSYPSRQ